MFKSVLKSSGVIFVTIIGFQNCSSNNLGDMFPKSGPSNDDLTKQSDRITDLQTLMLGVMDEEKNKRLETEATLNEKIDGVAADLAQFKTETKSAITNLETQSTAIQTQLTSQKSDYNSQISKVQENIDKMNSDLNGKVSLLDQNLNAALKMQIGDLTNLLNKQKQDILEQIKTNEGQNSIKFETIGAQLLKNEADVLGLAKSYAEFKTLITNTYSTKEDLKQLQSLFDSLTQVTNNLNMKLDVTKEQLESQLGDRIDNLNEKYEQLATKVNAQGNDLKDVKTDLLEAIKDYRFQIVEMSEQLTKNMTDNQQRMYLFIRKGNENLRDEFFNEMRKQSLEFTVYTRKAVGVIAARVEALQNQVDNDAGLTQDQINVLKDTLKITREEMAEALAEEQTARQQLTDDLLALTNKVNLIQKDLTLTQSIVAQNASQIQKLTISFEQEKSKVASRFEAEREQTDQKIAQLNQDFQGKLQKVAEQAEDLVKELGEDVKKNFKSVVTDIAILNSRQATVENNLKAFVEEYQSNRAKTLNLEINLQKPKGEATDALVSSMRELSQVQLDFIRILDLDEDRKEYYNDTFASVAKKCDGSVDTSFPNALGLDSFQILSMEYSRLLLLGERTGDSKIDKMFHSFGEASTDDNFHRLLMLALIRYPVGSEKPSCLEEIQGWARGVLLNDSQFQDRRQFLAADEELARSIESMYSALSKLEKPANAIEELIEGSLQGTLQFQAAFSAIKSKTALELINNAQSSLFLADRVETLARMSEFNEENSEDKTAVTKKINHLKADLDAFKANTNQRLTALESQQGKMQTAVKRALDVIISLSDRAGYTDLKAYTVWAGSSIDYVPQVVPGFMPKIQQVQHFFSGPLSSKNRADACTGAKILVNGGIQSQYQYGRWGSCWVNFRAFPQSSWNNETKTLWFRVFGAANAINIKVEPKLQNLTNVHEYTKRTAAQWAALWSGYKYDKTFDFRNLGPNDPIMKLTGTFSAGVFDIKASDALDYYIQNIRQWSGVKLTFIPLKLDQFGDQQSEMVGPTSYYIIQLFSPLIIDMKKKGVPRTLSSSDSNIKFDLMATGKPQRIGWVSGDEAGLLVLADAKGNVKDGSQLFGEATVIKKTGLKAKNGFEALSQYDENGDSIIDSKDPVFTKLKVWQDSTLNGKVEPTELKSLKELGIQSINLNFKEVDPKVRQNNGNDLRYVSESDVKVYDVFFGMSVEEK
jgi:hypothetical protein